MKKMAVLFILIVLVIIQATALEYIKIFNVKPDLILAAIIFLGFSYNERWVLFFSVCAGFLKDIFSSGPMGLNTFIFVLIGYTASRLLKKFIIETIYLRMAIISLAVILENIIAWFILSFYANPAPLGIFLKLTFISAVYTALILPLIVKIINPL